MNLYDAAFDALAECECDTYGDHRKGVVAVLTMFRDDVRREDAAKIRAEADATCAADDSRWSGMNAAADLIDPGDTCDCGEPDCGCGCQGGERDRHWIHSRSCGLVKEGPD